jgi:hypothetical protein
LDQGDVTNARAVFDGLASRAAPALQDLALYTVASYGDVLMDDVAHAAARGTRFWAHYFDRHGRGDETGSDRFTYNLHGGSGGIETALGPQTRAGIAAGAANGVTAFGGAGDLSAAFVSLTLRQRLRKLNVTGAFTYGRARLSAVRSRTLLAGPQDLRSRTHANIWAANVHAALPLRIGPATLSPEAGVRYGKASLGALREDAPLAQSTSAAAAQSLQTDIAMRATIDVGRIHPYAAVVWSHEMLSTRRQARAGLVDVAGSGFSVFGARHARDVARTRGGLAADIAPGVMVHAGVETALNSAVYGTSWSAGLSWQW